MEKKYICSNDINLIYGDLHNLCTQGGFCPDPVIVCLQNYDGNSIPSDCNREKEVREKLTDLLNEDGGRYFRFNHGSKYFSKDIFPSNKGIEYKSQFKKAVELIKNDHFDKAIMQVILPDMLQGQLSPLPAVISVVLKPKKIKSEIFLDIVGLYRTQEFSTWWPLNILELSYIKQKAIEELGSLYLPGDIITFAIQGNWNPNIPLGNKSLLDDAIESEKISKFLLQLFNFSANVDKRINACEKIIAALEEKKNVTSVFSYDVDGIKLLIQKISFVEEILEQDEKTEKDELIFWKNNRQGIHKKLQSITDSLCECGNRYSRQHTGIEKWSKKVNDEFTCLIELCQSLLDKLKG